MILNLALGRLEPPTSPLWEARSNLLSYRAIVNLTKTFKSVRVGFEPTKPVTAWLVSSELISASHPPHQITNSWIEYMELLLYFKRKYLENSTACKCFINLKYQINIIQDYENIVNIYSISNIFYLKLYIFVINISCKK